MTKRKEIIYLPNNIYEVKIFGFVSQKLAHELINELGNLISNEFRKFSVNNIEGFESHDGKCHYFLLVNKSFPDINVDYLFIVVGDKFMEFQSNYFNSLKNNQLVLGVYELNLSRKKIATLLKQLSV